MTLNLPQFLNGSRVRDLMGLQRQMDHAFDDFWDPRSEWPALAGKPAFTPSCDVQKVGNQYQMSFDLPGVKKEDIQIEVHDGVLTVSGERKEESEQKEKRKYRMERFYGSFSRSFQIPSGVRSEQIQARYVDGVLKLSIPIGESVQSKPIRID